MYSIYLNVIEILFEKNSISFEEAKHKVARAVNNMSKQEGIDLDTAIENILHL